MPHHNDHRQRMKHLSEHALCVRCKEAGQSSIAVRVNERMVCGQVKKEALCGPCEAKRQRMEEWRLE